MVYVTRLFNNCKTKLIILSLFFGLLSFLLSNTDYDLIRRTENLAFELVII